MKTIKFLTYSVFVLLLSISISSCKGDDGAVGPAGADGIDGTNGTNGSDGADGNANVQTYVFNDPTWGVEMNITIPAITQSVFDNDVVLCYVNIGTAFWYPVPGSSYGNAYYYRSYYKVGHYLIQAKDWDGSSHSNPTALSKVKIIIIESSNTTTTSGNGARPANTKQQILNELENAGVDINDYQAVCDYYGIDTE